MNWNVAEAKKNLSKVLRAAAEEPQRIYNRKKLMATIVDGELFEEFWHWKKEFERRSIGQEFARLRAICREEAGWELPDVPRRDRPNPLAESLEDAALRHERPE